MLFSIEISNSTHPGVLFLRFCQFALVLHISILFQSIHHTRRPQTVSFSSNSPSTKMIPVDISLQHLCILYLLLAGVSLSTSQISDSTDSWTGTSLFVLPVVQSRTPIDTSAHSVVYVVIPNARQMLSISSYDSQL